MTTDTLPKAASQTINTELGPIVITGISKGAGNPLKDKVGKISEAKLREIAEKKLPDLNANGVEGAMKIIAGTARSMGIKIEN